MKLKLCHLRLQRGILLLVCCLALLGALWPVGSAQAHARYDRSDPPTNFRFESGQAPTTIQVWFTERIEPSFSRLEVYDSERQRVDLDDSAVSPDDPYLMAISLAPGLPDGPYTVVYRNVSQDDGHAENGGFSFVVGGGTLPSAVDLLESLPQDNNFNIWSIVIRWVNYLGLALLIGGLVFLLTVWYPAAVRVQETVGNELELANKQVWVLVRQLIIWSLLALLLGWVAFLLYQASLVSATTPWQALADGAVGDLLLRIRFGHVWLVRLGLIVVALLVWWLLRRMTQESLRTQWLLWLLVAVGIGIGLTTTLNSHASAHRLNWLLVPSDVLHLAGVGFWVGGVFAFVLAGILATRVFVPGTGDRTRMVSALISRFSLIAIISVILLAITGVVAAVAQIGTWEALFSSDYGRALIVKLCLFGVLLLFGAFHQRILGKRLKIFAARNDEEGGASSLGAGKLQRTFQTSLRNEAVFAILLLLVVGVMTSLSPPPPTANAGDQMLYQGQMADLTYRLAISPGKAGPNNFELSLTDEQGQPVTSANYIVLRFTHMDMDMGVQLLEFTPIADKPGHYQSSGTVLSMLGRWEIGALVQRAGVDDARTTIEFTLLE